ncbi:MAG TPA: fructose-1,6-bisphosphate aldolase, class II [Clostridium sp.]|jgi:fructose-bisphosphate aldolase class II|uniref:Class II fructose-1,6-bisphosphate aldolase n=1 Tax=Clostridium lapidicellarium TaxID=3240931 RepID=A0ABV4DXA6_9CLOT|nr:class II fructose-1,6-bisphosphate aldolase [uncultured Clostridium sp.]NLU08969.1 class II fructose-1,6-bisphosphate aldolase [Clostridiales bacterium]HBC98011.1 fructose-1,6-bisphosphate aldolase, class II [Clostridium sp.]
MALVTTKDMFKKAYEGKYAIGAFNINNMEIIQGVVNGAKAKNSAVILQCSAGALKYAGPKYLKAMVDAAIEDTGIDLALHLDHGPDLETVKVCVETGFTSVMFDGSHLDYEENVEKTKQIAKYAHEHGVVVEAELGVLAGVEDDVSSEKHTYTDPDQAVDFVNKTGVDSLAIAIGTSHGAYKFPPNFKPKLRFDILEEVQNKLPNFPIVLHGASSVDQNAVATCNKYGGNLKGAKGIPVDMLRKASSMAVCKINVDTDLRIAMTAAARKTFGDDPTIFDPRKYLGAGRDAIQKVVEDKIANVLGSENSLN